MKVVQLLGSTPQNYKAAGMSDHDIQSIHDIVSLDDTDSRNSSDTPLIISLDEFSDEDYVLPCINSIEPITTALAETQENPRVRIRSCVQDRADGGSLRNMRGWTPDMLETSIIKSSDGDSDIDYDLLIMPDTPRRRAFHHTLRCVTLRFLHCMCCLNTKYPAYCSC